MIPSGWFLEAVFGDNMNLEGFGGYLRYAAWDQSCEYE